jgi:hypothetical protein
MERTWSKLELLLFKSPRTARTHPEKGRTITVVSSPLKFHEYVYNHGGVLLAGAKQVVVAKSGNTYLWTYAQVMEVHFGLTRIKAYSNLIGVSGVPGWFTQQEISELYLAKQGNK